jgi:hypoxanthine phosphoribosyltransferase
LKVLAPSWDEIYELGMSLAEKVLKEFDFDAIVGVSRGGLTTARIFSDLLEVKDIIIIKSEHYDGIDVLKDVNVEQRNIPDLSKHSVLVTDDIADTGESLERISELLIPKIQSLKTLCFYKKKSSAFTPDFYQEETDAWIIFPWDRLEAIKALQTKGMSMEEIIEAGIDEKVFRRIKRLSIINE